MVPEGWKPVKLGHISSLITSGSRDWAKFYSDVGSKFIRMTNLRRDGIHLKTDDLKFVNIKSGSADGKRTSLQAGDILISITAELGKIGWVPPGLGEAYINQHTALIRVKPKESDSKFLAYLLSSKPYHRRINALNDAGAKAGLNLATIRSLPISLPDIPEQKKIAQILSTWDQVITATERLLENSQQRKKGLMQQLLTGKKRLPGFEGKWEDGHLKDIAAISKGKALSSKDLEYGDFPVVAGGKTSPYTHKTYTHDHAITVSASGAYAGYVAYHEYKFWASDCSVVEASEESNIEFLFHLMTWNQQRIYALQSGGAQPHVYPKDLNAIRVLIPSKKEQQAIANILTTASKETEQLQNRVNRLKQEKKALMQQLLTGKRRVIVDMEAA